MPLYILCVGFYKEGCCHGSHICVSLKKNIKVDVFCILRDFTHPTLTQDDLVFGIKNLSRQELSCGYHVVAEYLQSKIEMSIWRSSLKTSDFNPQTNMNIFVKIVTVNYKISCRCMRKGLSTVNMLADFDIFCINAKKKELLMMLLSIRVNICQKWVFGLWVLLCCSSYLISDELWS